MKIKELGGRIKASNLFQHRHSTGMRIAKI
jgi:hypothetical protein